MTKLLNIIASPRGETSTSTQLAQTHIAALKQQDPTLEVDTLDLWQEDLIDFDGDKAAAKMTFFGVGDMDNTRQSAWDQVVAVTDRFMQADHYVFSVPMWNGGIPYKLKQYIDIITQPGLLFGFDPEKGYFGLLENKKASVFYTSGVYAPGVAPQYGSDFHSAYLDWWLNVVGITDINTVRFQPSLVTADPEGELATALETAATIAAQ